MRRAGWKVWVADEVDGSYEQVPPNLLAELQRDRRWCQGNLQNARLMIEPGMHPVHRITFLTGVLAYASSPLWLAFLLLSTLLFAQPRGHAIRSTSPSPTSSSRSGRRRTCALMLTLFGLTAVLLLAPKVLSLIAIIVPRPGPALRRRRARCSPAPLIEFVHSLLLAPVRMLFHTQFVLAALTGWRLDWKSPPRDDAPTAWREAAARHGAAHAAHASRWIAPDRRRRIGVPVVAVADPARPAGRRCRSRPGAAGPVVGRWLARARPPADARGDSRAADPARRAGCCQRRHRRAGRRFRRRPSRDRAAARRASAPRCQNAAAPHGAKAAGAEPLARARARPRARRALAPARAAAPAVEPRRRCAVCMARWLPARLTPEWWTPTPEAGGEAGLGRAGARRAAESGAGGRNLNAHRPGL